MTTAQIVRQGCRWIGRSPRGSARRPAATKHLHPKVLCTRSRSRRLVHVGSRHRCCEGQWRSIFTSVWRVSWSAGALFLLRPRHSLSPLLESIPGQVCPPVSDRDHSVFAWPGTKPSSGVPQGARGTASRFLVMQSETAGFESTERRNEYGCPLVDVPRRAREPWDAVLSAHRSW